MLSWLQKSLDISYVTKANALKRETVETKTEVHTFRQ